MICNKNYFHLICAAVLTFFVFSFMLGARPLTVPDEARYTSISVAMLQTGDYVTPKLNTIRFLDKPNLFYWVQAATIHWFGKSNWVFRLTPFFFASLGGLALFIFALKFYDPRTAWIGLLVLISSPLYFLMAHYINMDMMIAVMISMTLFSMRAFTLVEPTYQKKLFLYFAYFFAALGFLTKGLIGFVIPGLTILTWVIWQRQWKLLKEMISPVGILIFLLITLPWLIVMEKANPDFLHYFFIFEQFERFSQGGFNNAMPFWFYIPVILIGMLPWSILLLSSAFYFIQKKSNLVKPNDAFLLSWVFVVLFFFSFPQSKIVSYILPLFPPIALLLARYIIQIECSSSWNNWKRYLSAIGSLTYIFASIGMSLTIVFYWKNSWILPIKSYLISINIVLYLSALLTFLFYQYKQWLLQIYIVATSTIIILLIANAASAFWPTQSYLNYLPILQKELKPNDKLFSFDSYPFDLPIYFNHPIGIVAKWDKISINTDNWKGHFQYGATPVQKENLLLTFAQFCQLWKTKTKIFLIMPKSIYRENKFCVPAKTYIISQNKQSLLLVNHQGP